MRNSNRAPQPRNQSDFMSTDKKHRFVTNCVNWKPEDVHAEGGLCDLISDAKDIIRDTFLRHVDRIDREAVECDLGYAPHDRDSSLTMRHGKTVYFFKHSQSSTCSRYETPA